MHEASSVFIFRIVIIFLEGFAFYIPLTYRQKKGESFMDSNERQTHKNSNVTLREELHPINRIELITRDAKTGIIIIIKKRNRSSAKDSPNAHPSDPNISTKGAQLCSLAQP